MDEYADPGDFLEPDEYEMFESRYEDELEMVDDFPTNNNFRKVDKIDFQIDMQKSHEELDRGLMESTMSETKVGKKRSLSHGDSEDELIYSEDEEETPKKETQAKKLKIGAKKNLVDSLSEIKEQLRNNIDDIGHFNVSEYEISRRRVFKRPLLGMDTLNVTSTEGDRVFLKLATDAEANSDVTFRGSQDINGLLSVPFDDLLAEVSEKRHARQLQRFHDSDHRVPELQETKAMSLWVDKYSPSKYTDLLSDDGTNRLLLKWLKLWDNIVFHEGRAINRREEEKKEAALKKKQEARFKRKDFKASRQVLMEEDLIHDKKGRPKQKIALLCGNPGLGKTTLAHVISKHAGYNVIEMNASDDRSPEMFRNKIETSVQMKGTVTGQKQPNCLIIDEIDGAPVQAINILIDLVKATENVTSAPKNSTKKKKKKKRDFVLNRPIICICNDPYVPALRSLRHVAFTLYFPPTLQSRLADRLLAISQVEDIRIDMGSLLMLAEKTENDIRSCLNTLQFIQQRMKDFKAEDIRTMDVGQKDMKKGVRTILPQVFQIPRVSRKKLIGNVNNNRDIQVKTGASARFHYMLHVVSGNTDFEKMTQGLFDHYLKCKTKDPYLESINAGAEWLCFADQVQEQIQHQQNYILRRYSVYLPVAFHMYFAQTSTVKIQYSNVAYENHLKHATNQQTLQLMLTGMSPSVRRNCIKNTTLLEVIPFLFLVTLPSLRPVNMKLYSNSEKQVFSSLVQTMLSYNLTYRQERNNEGQYTYLLEPNIEELMTFTGLPQHKHLAYAIKQLIAREIDMEKMRKAERLMKAQDEEKDVSNKSTIDVIKANQKMQPKKIQEKEHVQLDFFGRVVKDSPSKSKREEQKRSNSSLLNKTIRYRFNEGYTNAVRRRVKIKDFL